VPVARREPPAVEPPWSPTLVDAEPPLSPLAEQDAIEAIDKAAAQDWVGQQIAGKYRIDEVIGRGGMGVVLRATHRSLDEPVAIKVLRPSMMAVPGMVMRFTREARAASKIRSEHVARVTDVDTLESGVPYMVMEYLEGMDLAVMLREQGRLSIDLAVRWIRQACDAIAEAHANGVVHRDLKPSNLFLARRSDGRELIKVLDFGISKIEGPSIEDATRTGTMMGSPKFMAPEQMVSMHNVDSRADLWSLGAILYTLLTGISPFMAQSTPQVCALVLGSEPVPPSVHRADIPAELEAIVLRCLQKNPVKRFSTATELRRALAPFDPSAPAAGRSDEALKAPPALVEEQPVVAAPDLAASTQPLSTAMVASVDTMVFLPKRRSSGVILGGLALTLAIGLGALVFAARREPMEIGATSTKATGMSAAPAPLPVDPPSAAATPAPVPSISAEGVTAQPSSAPTSMSPNPLSLKKPRASAPGAKKPAATADPFGGSRN
jgi:serine/threonine protein kinase